MESTNKNNSPPLSKEFVNKLIEISQKRLYIITEIKKELLLKNYNKVIELAEILTGLTDKDLTIEEKFKA